MSSRWGRGEQKIISRRQFIQLIGLIGGTLLVSLEKLVGFTAYAKEGPGSNGEIYAGFLILNNCSDFVPAFVIDTPCPIFGTLDKVDDCDHPLIAFCGETIRIGKVDELENLIRFPLYLPNFLPEEGRFLFGQITRFTKSEKVWEVRLDYGIREDERSILSISARTLFPKPFPIWPAILPVQDTDIMGSQEGFEIRQPAKVGFTPIPGLMTTYDDGFLLQWIIDEILYSIFVENPEWFGKAEYICSILVKI